MLGGLLTVVVVVWFLRAGFRRWRGGTPDMAAFLAGAEAAGIITTAQREQLLVHAAASDAGGSRFGGAAWLGVFAGLFVVAGVSLLIAHNWASIGAATRVAAFVLLLLAVGEGAIRARERSLGLALPLEILWFFLPLLGIGLYGQTFQLSGDPIQPFLVWLALTAALAWLSPRPVVAAIHTATMVGVLFVGNFALGTAFDLLDGGTLRSPGMLAITETASTPAAWALTAVLLAAITLQSLRLLPPAHRHHVVGVFAFWVFALLVAPTALRLEHPGWIVVAAVGLATLWLVVLIALDCSTEEHLAAAVVWLSTLYGLTFTWHMHSAADGATTRLGVAVVTLVVATACGGASLLPARRLSPLPGWARGARLLLAAPPLVALLYLGASVELVWIAAVAMNLLLVWTAVGLMWHGSLVHEVAQINLGVLVLVWVLITRFLDLFGGMLRSGVGFIVAGLLLAALSWTLERTRRRLIAGPREVAP